MKKEVKLRTEFKKIVSSAKRNLLKDRFITKEWLKAFKTTTKPDDVHITGVVKAKYRAFMGSKY